METPSSVKSYFAQIGRKGHQEAPKISLDDIPEIVRGLRQNGGRRGFLVAAKLCR